jgi:hypothetical protein
MTEITELGLTLILHRFQPPIVGAVFGLLLPWLIRKLTKYQGAVRLRLAGLGYEEYLTDCYLFLFLFASPLQTSRSETDRTVLTRLYAFLVISQFIVFSLLSVVISLIFSIVKDIRQKKGSSAILSNLSGESTSLPFLSAITQA